MLWAARRCASLLGWGCRPHSPLKGCCTRPLHTWPLNAPERTGGGWGETGGRHKNSGYTLDAEWVPMVLRFCLNYSEYTRRYRCNLLIKFVMITSTLGMSATSSLQCIAELKKNNKKQELPNFMQWHMMWFITLGMNIVAQYSDSLFSKNSWIKFMISMIHNTILLTLNEPVKRMVVSYKEFERL